MSKNGKYADPHAEREAARYENPIPSREAILELLAGAKKPLNPNKIASKLGLENVEQVEAYLEKAKGSDLILLPENALYFRVSSKAPKFALTGEEDFWAKWQKWCADNDTSIMVGASPYKKDGKTMNSTIWIKPDGVELPYDKIHLFDVDVDGHKPVRESDQFGHGSDTNIVEWKGFKFGLSVCYDLRFPELFLRYAKAGVDAILVPAAFLVPTGRAHWHTLLKARAIESQCYVMAAAQGGEHKNEDSVRKTFGHSLAIDPWGEVLAEKDDDQVGLISFELQKDRIQQVRTQIPMANHRRLE